MDKVIRAQTFELAIMNEKLDCITYQMVLKQPCRLMHQGIRDFSPLRQWEMTTGNMLDMLFQLELLQQHDDDIVSLEEILDCFIQAIHKNARETSS